MKPITFLAAAIFCTIVCVSAFGQVKETVITTAVHKVFTIKVPSNPSTGYSWVLSDSLNAAFLKKVATSYERDPNAKAKVGAGGTQIFTLKALKKGSAKVKLVYTRPWIKPVPADANRMSFLVKIK